MFVFYKKVWNGPEPPPPCGKFPHFLFIFFFEGFPKIFSMSYVLTFLSIDSDKAVYDNDQSIKGTGKCKVSHGSLQPESFIDV